VRDLVALADERLSNHERSGHDPSSYGFRDA
jgi:hypothetical protein